MSRVVLNWNAIQNPWPVRAQSLFCSDRECGTNGCENGNCGTCEVAESCVDGQCCLSNCIDRECGSDGCGQLCGMCEPGQQCTADGKCCTPQDCEPGSCGVDSLGCPCENCGPLGTCAGGSASAFRIAPIKRAEVMAVEVRVAAAVRECTVSKANVWRRILAGRAQRDSPARKTVDANVPRSRGVLGCRNR